MTTYILFGGNDREMTDAQNAKLRDAVLAKLNGAKPKIASVMFANLREDWEWKFRDRRTPVFQRLFGENYEAHLVYPDQFRDEIKWANVVYLHGGDTTLLAYYLDKFKDLPEIFADKIVIGSSAGACYISAITWEGDWRFVRRDVCRGLVKVASIPHFASAYGADFDPRGAIDWPTAEKELRAATDLPIVKLPEGEFEMFEEKI
jgi:peptidase E